MARCKCCNSDFNPRINKKIDQEEDLCSYCLLIAKYAALDIEEETDDIEATLDMLDVMDEYN